MEIYEFYNWGTCLGDVVPNGSFLQVDPASSIQVGDIVTVVLKHVGPFSAFSRSLTANDLLGVTKIFLGCQTSATGETIYVVGQLSPPLVSPIPASVVEAMHLVVGGQAPEGTEKTMNDEDRAAMELLSPFFCGTGDYPSINPNWQPPE